jgi:hypothetical protein
VLWSYRQQAARLSVGQRACLAGLRLLALALLLAISMQPAVSLSLAGTAPVVVLIDQSASMNWPDAGPAIPSTSSTGAERSVAPTETSSSPSRNGATPSPTARASTETGLTKTGLGAPLSTGLGPSASGQTSEQTRWNAVMQAVNRSDGRWWQQLLSDHPLRVYQFSEEAIPLTSGDVATAEELPSLLNRLQDLSATGTATRPATAVQSVLADLRGRPPAALVVITDGVSSEGDTERLSNVAAEFRQAGCLPIFVPVGSQQAVKDIELADVVVDDVAFLGDPVLLSGRIRAQGLANQSATIRVSRADSGIVLSEQTLVIEPNERLQRFECSWTPSEAGTWPVKIEVLPLDGERLQDNNHQTREVQVRSERLKVLLVESRPRFEFRFLKQWLERDQTIELKTVLVEADPEYAQEDRTALPYFPSTQQELWQFDVVIVGDVAPTQLGASAGDGLLAFVREKGGGLLWLSGPLANPWTFGDSPWAGLLPFLPGNVIPPSERAGLAAGADTAFRPLLTLDGQLGVPFFRLADQESQALAVWQQLPGWYWFVSVASVKPGVRVLAQHPLVAHEGERAPLITVQQVGAGKVLWHASDELWRWRFRTGDRYFGKYYSQAIRYLCRSRHLAQDRLAELVLDRSIYRRGEPVGLRVRFLDEQFLPPEADGVHVLIEQANGPRRDIALSRLAHLPTVFEANATGLPAGSYRAWVSRPTFGTESPALQATFRIDHHDREMLDVATDLADLELAARRSGGQVVPLTQIDTIPERIPSGPSIALQPGTPQPLWMRWEPLLLLMGVLTLEWLLRRWWRLL